MIEILSQRQVWGQGQGQGQIWCSSGVVFAWNAIDVMLTGDQDENSSFICRSDLLLLASKLCAQSNEVVYVLFVRSVRFVFLFFSVTLWMEVICRKFPRVTYLWHARSTLIKTSAAAAPYSRQCIVQVVKRTVGYPDIQGPRGLVKKFSEKIIGFRIVYPL